MQTLTLPTALGPDVLCPATSASQPCTLSQQMHQDLSFSCRRSKVRVQQTKKLVINYRCVVIFRSGRP